MPVYRDGAYFGEAETIEDAVGQAMGAASTCWEHVDRAGVFDPVRAMEIADALIEFIASKQPMLGYATTHDLIRELWARADIGKTVGEAWPNYRTVDSS